MKNPETCGKESPIFIGGAGRSGTTLLRVMLNSHSHLAAGPEFKMLPNIMDLYQQLLELTSVRKAYHLTEMGLNQSFAALIGELFENYRVKHNAQRIVEKTPHNVFVMKELGRVFPKAKFIHVVRDGRDVVCSLTNMNWYDLRGNPVWYTQNVKNAVTYWVQVVTQGLINANEKGLKERVKLIHYEALIDNPETTLRNILTFINEPWESQLLEHYEHMRGYEPEESSTKQVSKKIYHGSKGRWKRELSLSDQNTIKQIGGELLMKLGYEHSLSW